MAIVKKTPGKSDDALIREFSRKSLFEGIVKEAKDRQFHLKPSLRRKQKQQDERRMRRTYS